MTDKENIRIPTDSNGFEVIAGSLRYPWGNPPERHKELSVDGWEKLPGMDWYYHVKGIKGEKGEERKELAVLVNRDGKWLGMTVNAAIDEFQPSQIVMVGLLTEIGLEIQDRQNIELNLQARYQDITNKNPQLRDFLGGKGVGT